MQLLTTGQAAKLLRVSLDTIIRICESGELPCERVRRLSPRRIRLDDLIAYAERYHLTLNLPEENSQ